MRRSWTIALALAGCGDKAPPKTPSPPPEPAAVAPAPAKETTALGPIVLPGGVPAIVAAVAVIRSQQGLTESVRALDPLTGGDAHVTSMLSEIEDYLRGRLGVELAQVRQMTIYALPGEPKVAAIFASDSGITGTVGESVGDVGGVALHRIEGEELVVASVEQTVFVGHRAAVVAGLEAMQQRKPALVAGGGAMVQLLTRHGTGSSYAVAFTASALSGELGRALTQASVHYGAAALGPDGLVLVAKGEAPAMATLKSEVTTWVGLAERWAEEHKEQAMESDDPALVVLGIAAEHSLARLAALVTPTVSDGELVVRIPIERPSLDAAAPVLMLAAAAALPAATRYLRQSKTSEARVQLAKMFDAASSHFTETRITVSVLPSGSSVASKGHVCPNDGREQGEAGITPPLSIDCASAAAGRCVPVPGAPSKVAGEYEAELWSDNPVWRGLDFEHTAGHYFHYDFKYENFPGGFGGCQFTAQAFGDLDGDGVFSTYERVGVADERGVSSVRGLRIEQPLE
ncbi:MAG: hypothetical protein AAF721_14550 [Myxococcota bacterium]